MYEERNCKIKESSKATRERHSNMDCCVVSVKIQENRLSKAKLGKLIRFFLEAKWLYNAYRSLNTDADSTNKMMNLLVHLFPVGVVVNTTRSM